MKKPASSMLGQKKKSVQPPLGYSSTSQIARFKQNATHVNHNSTSSRKKCQATLTSRSTVNAHSKNAMNKQMAKSMVDRQQELGGTQSPSRNLDIGSAFGIRSLDQEQAPKES